MEQKKRRSENWSTEEKEILRELISQSRHIIEDKCTKASSNLKKAQEWKNIAMRLNELTGKNRAVSDVKLAWKRMKLLAKANLSAYRQQLIQTGGGEKPKSPSQEDLVIMDIAPHDFVVEYNDYDSDAIEVIVPGQIENTAGPSTDFQLNTTPNINDEIDVIVDQGTSNIEDVIVDPGISNVEVGTATPKKKKIFREKKHPKNLKDTMQLSILKSNTQFKKRHIEMLEEEHKYTIKIAELKIKKLNLEIDLLEIKKNSSNQ